MVPLWNKEIITIWFIAKVNTLTWSKINWNWVSDKLIELNLLWIKQKPANLAGFSFCRLKDITIEHLIPILTFLDGINC